MDFQNSPNNMAFSMSFEDFQKEHEQLNPLDLIGKWVDLSVDTPYRVIEIEWKKSNFTTPSGEEKWSAILTVSNTDGRLERVWAPSSLTKPFMERDIALSDKAVIVVNEGIRKTKDSNHRYHAARYIEMEKNRFEKNYASLNQPGGQATSYKVRYDFEQVCIFLCNSGYSTVARDVYRLYSLFVAICRLVILILFYRLKTRILPIFILI